jgi:hypothetical protein
LLWHDLFFLHLLELPKAQAGLLIRLISRPPTSLAIRLPLLWTDNGHFHILGSSYGQWKKSALIAEATGRYVVWQSLLR